MTICRSICVAANGIISLFFMAVDSIFLFLNLFMSVLGDSIFLKSRCSGTFHLL